jgi:hypothetical protein
MASEVDHFPIGPSPRRGPATFSERLRRRQELWWGVESGIARLHRAREILIARDPGAGSLRCCARWQRSLSNKLSSRAFAAAHGCRVPQLYWSGRIPDRLPIGSLPSRFVVKPAFGNRGAGVHVLCDGVDLFGHARYDARTLRRHLRSSFGLVSPIALIAEEFVRDESGVLSVPTSYKFYMFGEQVAAIEASRGTAPDSHDNPRRGYTADWRPFEPSLRSAEYRTGDFAPPSCLDEMLDVARRLGRAYGAFVRVDLYASDRGCVFGELASSPSRGTGFSPQADRILGEMWQDVFPDGE